MVPSCGGERDTVAVVSIDRRLMLLGIGSCVFSAMIADTLRLKSPLPLGLVKGSLSLLSLSSAIGAVTWRPLCIDACWWRMLATSGWFRAVATEYGVEPYYMRTDVALISFSFLW